MNSLEHLKTLRACPDGLKWVRSAGDPETQAGWEACPRGEWLAWYAGKRTVDFQRLTTALQECAALTEGVTIPDLPTAKDAGLEAAKVIAAVAAKFPGKYTETMLRCAEIIRQHYPLVP